MTALRLPVEAERLQSDGGEMWFVRNEFAGCLARTLLGACLGLADEQQNGLGTPAALRTRTRDVWLSRIAEEKARWETRSDRNAPPPVASLVGALHGKAHTDIGRGRAALSVRVASPTEQPFTPSEESRYHDDFLRTQAALNARPAPSEHRL